MNDTSEIKALLESQGQTFAAFKAANDELSAQVKKLGAADAVTEEKLARMDAALTALDEAKTAIEAKALAIEKRVTRPGGGATGGVDDAEVKAFNALTRGHASASNRQAPADVDAGQYEEYKRAFGAAMRKDGRVLSGDEVKALAVGTDPDGGFLVPADMTGRIVTRIFETSPIRQIASVQTISTDALEGIRDTDEAGSGGWVAEQDARGETSTPQIGKWRIPVNEMFAQPHATQQILDDAAIDIEAWLGRKVADRLTRVENAAFVVGDGVGKPRGIASYLTAATGDGARAWGTLEHVNTGANGDFLGTTSATQNPADVLFDLIGAFKDAYLQGARWLTRREVITKIRRFKLTDGAYVWQPGLALGQPQQILGFPVTVAQDMPALGTGSLSMAFGDFAEGYQIVDRQGFRVLRDPYTAKPFVKFYTTRRVGGGVINSEAIKFLRFAA